MLVLSIIFPCLHPFPCSPTLPFHALWLPPRAVTGGTWARLCRAQTFHVLCWGELPQPTACVSLLLDEHWGAARRVLAALAAVLGMGGITYGCLAPSKGGMAPWSEFCSHSHSCSWVQCKPSAGPTEYALGVLVTETGAALMNPFFTISAAQWLCAQAFSLHKATATSPVPYWDQSPQHLSRLCLSLVFFHV